MLQRPAVIAALALASGILASALLGESATPLRILALVTAGLSLVVGLLADRAREVIRGRPAYVLTAAAILFAVGSARLAQSDTSWRHFLDAAMACDSLRGRVAGPVSRDSTATRFAIRLTGAAPIRGRTVSVRVVRRALLAIPDSLLVSGAEVVLIGPLDLVQPRRNPADIDYATIAWARGISGSTTISDTGVIRLSPGTPSAIERFRNHVRTSIQRHVEASAQPILGALLLGDRSQIDRRARDALSRTGLMHLLAVSGLHVLLIGLAAYRIFKSILVRLRMPWYAMEWIRVPLTIALLLLYAAVTGMHPSAVRAVIMGSLFLCGALVRRRPDARNLLGVAACIILVRRPEQLLAAGFQLSFSAVAAILLIAGPIRDIIPGGNRLATIRSSLATSIAASVGTAPTMMYTFGYTPVAGLVLNILAIPLTAAALSAGVLTVLSAPLAPSLASYFGQTAGLAVDTLVSGSLGIAEHVPIVSDRAFLSTKAQVITAGTLITLVAHVSRSSERWRYTVGIWGMAAIMIASTEVTSVIRAASSHATIDVIFADVGQGDAAIIRTPNKRFVAIDVGPPGLRSSPAQRSLVPLLRQLGARQLDAVVVSHPHADHDGGLPSILEAFDVEQIIAEQTAPEEAYVENTVSALYAGDHFTLDGVLFEVVSPPRPSLRDARFASVNNASIVIRLTFGTSCITFMGDAETEAEHYLIQTRTPLDCEIIKVGHHGSRTSSTLPFVNTSRILRDRAHEADLHAAVISVGTQNRFGHPDTSVVSRWQRSGRKVLTTTRGAIWTRGDGTGFYIHNWRRPLERGYGHE